MNTQQPSDREEGTRLRMLHQPEGSGNNTGSMSTANTRKAGIRPASVPAPEHRPAAANALREHQLAAVAAVDTTLDRQQIIMACGTGKTITGSHAVTKLLTGTAGNVLILVPTLTLLQQTFESWSAHAPFGFDAIAVCSKLSGKERGAMGTEEDLDPSELPLPATTDAAEVAAFLAGETGRRVVFGTYQSLKVISAAHTDHAAPRWDVVVCDEAHRTAGSANKPFAQVLHDTVVPAKRRLFLTATPKVHTVSAKETATETLLASMDDESLYGPAVYTLSVADAVERGILSDYQVAVIGVEDDELHAATQLLDQVTVDGQRLDLDHVAAIVALSKAARTSDLRAVISFFNSIKASKSFVAAFNAVHNANSGGHLADGVAQHIDGSMKLDVRSEALENLAQPRDNGFHLVSNARCLSEGIDVPLLDAVFFGEPRNSQIEVVQCVGRAIRKNPRSDAPALIVLGVRVGSGGDPDTAIDESQFKKIRQVIAALGDHDPRIAAAAITLARAGNSDGRDRPSDDEVDAAKQLLSLDVPERMLSGGFGLRMLDQAQQTWESGYQELLRYAEVEGGAQVPVVHETASGFNLGTWVSHQRAKYRTRELSLERITKLESLPGWTWNRINSQWDAGLSELRTFVQARGHAQVPQRYQSVLGFRLGTWVAVQRRRYHGGNLPGDRILILEDLPGWTWDALDAQWDSALDLLREFVHQKGHAQVPNSHITASGFNLGSWVGTRRRNYRSGKLSRERISLLEGIPGWTWSTRDAGWDSALDELREFVHLEGHARVPNRHVTASGFNLGVWTFARRRDYRSGKLPQDRVLELEDLPGWTWVALDEQWDFGLSEIVAFANSKKHARVPQSYVTDSGLKLGFWVSNRRQEYRDGKLSQERVDELEAIHGWAWDALTAKRENRIAELHKFMEVEGHARVPVNHVTDSGFKLGTWVSNRRKDYRSGKLSPERIAELEALPGWVWDTRKSGGAAA